GTNGKSTTTALIHHVLKESGLEARMGGNIGLPILGEEPLPEGGVYVLELSSFQIDLTQSLAADVAVLLNITPDHLDRHGDMAGYAHAKERLFQMQKPGQAAVVSVDDEYCRAIARVCGERLCAVSTEQPQPAGVSVINGELVAEGVVLGQQSEWPDRKSTRLNSSHVK